MMLEAGPWAGLPFILTALLAAVWVLLLGENSSWR